jgi:PEP-CTERM motif
MIRFNLKALAVSVATALCAGIAHGGPVIIDGSDAEEHGFFNGTSNVAGWKYFQRGFENLLPQVGNGNNVVVCLGCTDNTQAAFASAFDLAVKPTGWTRETIDGEADIASFFADALNRKLANTGLIYIPTGANTAGGITSAELAVINANAGAINSFVGGAGNPLTGGGLFAHGEGGTVGAWGWLTTLIPDIVAIESGGANNLELTAAGTAVFPGLTNADITGAQPWHNHFEGKFGGLQVLVQTNSNGGGTAGRAVILGGGAGTVIGCDRPGQPQCTNGVPIPIPEPETLTLAGIACAAMALIGLRRRKRK